MQNLRDVCRWRRSVSPDEQTGSSRAARLLVWPLPLLASFALGFYATAAAEQDQSASKPANSDIEAYARLPVCTLSADGQHLAVQPCRTAPARVPMPRRPVPQQIDPLPYTRLAPPLASPQPTIVVAPAQAPISATAIAPAPAHVPVPASLAPAPMPRALNNCSGAGCNDAQGTRINSAAPGMVITPQGQVCSRNGVWIQC